MSNGAGLKKQWGVADPAKAGSDQQSQQFQAAFQSEITAIGVHLEYTATNAEVARHNPLAARRDGLYPRFQGALGQIDRTNPSKAHGPINDVLRDAKALNAEVAKFHTEAEKAKTDWDARQAKFDEAVKQVEELEAWDDPKTSALRGVVDGIRAQVNERKYAQASKTVDQLLPKLKPIYDEYLKQKEAKEKYEPALEALQPRLTKACAGEHVKLKPKQDEITVAQKEMEASAQTKNYVQALKQVGDLAAKVEAYELAVEELEKQKKAYEDAWAALQPKLAQAEQSQFKKLEPQQQTITAAKPPIEASAQKEEYEEALRQVNDLSTKVDAYLAAVEEAQKQKRAYEDAWAALQPRFDQTSQSQFKKLAPLQEELTKIKGQIDAAVQAEDYEQALKLVNDLSTKVDTYLSAVEEAAKQRKAYEDAWATVGPKFTEAMQSTSTKLAPKRDEMTALKEQSDKVVEAEDYEQALKLVNDLGTKVDAYLEAVKALEEQKQKYEEALHTLQPELDEIAKSPSKSLAPMRDEMAKIKGEMEKAAETEEYEQALKHVEDLKSKIKAYKDELNKEREEYTRELERVEVGIKDVDASKFAQLNAKKSEIMAGYESMKKLAEAEDYKAAVEAGRKLEVSISDYLAEVKKLRDSIQANIKAHLPQIEADLKELQDDKSPLKEKINPLYESVKAAASGNDDAALEKAPKDLEELSRLVDQLKNDPCAKARRSPEYKTALADLTIAQKESQVAALAMQKAKKMEAVSGQSSGVPDPVKLAEARWAVKQAEATHEVAIAKEMKAYEARIAILKKYGCNDTSE